MVVKSKTVQKVEIMCENIPHLSLSLLIISSIIVVSSPAPLPIKVTSSTTIVVSTVVVSTLTPSSSTIAPRVCHDELRWVAVTLGMSGCNQLVSVQVTTMKLGFLDFNVTFSTRCNFGNFEYNYRPFCKN